MPSKIATMIGRRKMTVGRVMIGRARVMIRVMIGKTRVMIQVMIGRKMTVGRVRLTRRIGRTRMQPKTIGRIRAKTIGRVAKTIGRVRATKTGPAARIGPETTSGTKTRAGIRGETEELMRNKTLSLSRTSKNLWQLLQPNMG